MIDTVTILIMSGLLTIVCAVIFVLNSAFGRQDKVALFWSSALVFAIMSSLSFAVYGVNSNQWWANSVGNAAIVAAMGCVWMGVRSFNSRYSRAWIVFGAGGVAFVATFLDSPVENEWAGAPVSWVGVAVFMALAAAECVRGRLKRSINSSILAVVVGAEALFYLGRLVVFLAYGPESPVFADWFGTGPTTGLAILLVVAGTLSISLLRLERANNFAEAGLFTDPGFSREGVLDWAHFTRGGSDRVVRAGMHDMSSGVVMLTIDSLDEINTAFGRDVGDRAINVLADVLRETMPPTSIIGRKSAGTFGVVTTMHEPDESVATIAALHNALVARSFDKRANLRLTVSIGVATASAPDAAWQQLFDDASARRDEAQARGGNLVLDGRA
ncbi:GGDEF domain-containing protein [Paramicrobacterium agarici]|uniref:Diguanylate cyclase (GGDEF)-like protein n=1 Tax=Paramicrobacterium agarici TaxID=630514 RepID=A0A2A9DVP2_9MICO|nr:diguanylate cyclase [Microbacterium agarici]PFG30654.1 diguanylate cyclase (GGDEF)-like protein [Microbacterium agarici]TQO23671.1 diguanylate cyclase (GGDEF)-like protein [Microbacterium agarici]